MGAWNVQRVMIPGYRDRGVGCSWRVIPSYGGAEVITLLCMREKIVASALKTT